MKFFDDLYKKGTATVRLLDPRSSQQEKLSAAFELKDSVTTFSNTIQDVKTGFAQTTVDVLEPVYGSGGVLEPVTVIVDPERTILEEYETPIDQFKDAAKQTADTALLALGAVALILLVK